MRCCTLRQLLAVATVLSVLCSTAYAAEAPPSKALVYIFQGETGHFAKLLVSVNGRQIESLPKNTYIALAADPGTHEISTAAAGRTATPLTVEANQTYYVLQQVGRDGMATHRVLTRAEAQSLLASYRSVRAAPASTTPSRAAPVTAGSYSPPPAPSAAPPPATTGRRFAVTPKIGSYKLKDASQEWLDVSSRVKTKASNVFAVSGEYEFGNGFALEPEALFFKTAWVQADGARGSFDATIITLNGKYRFGTSKVFRPFFGAGGGAGSASFDGDITGSTGGAVFQVFAGAEVRFDAIGIHLEYKYVSAETEDDDSNVVDMSGKGAFAGISIHF